MLNFPKSSGATATPQGFNSPPPVANRFTKFPSPSKTFTTPVGPESVTNKLPLMFTTLNCRFPAGNPGSVKFPGRATCVKFVSKTSIRPAAFVRRVQEHPRGPLCRRQTCVGNRRRRPRCRRHPNGRCRGRRHSRIPPHDRPVQTGEQESLRTCTSTLRNHEIAGSIEQLSRRRRRALLLPALATQNGLVVLPAAGQALIANHNPITRLPSIDMDPYSLVRITLLPLGPVRIRLPTVEFSTPSRTALPLMCTNASTRSILPTRKDLQARSTLPR